MHDRDGMLSACYRPCLERPSQVLVPQSALTDYYVEHMNWNHFDSSLLLT